MANQIYDTLKSGLLSATVDLVSDDIYALLVQEYNTTVTTSATELSGTISFEYSGTSALELTETSGVNYTSGGYVLTDKIVSASSTAGTLYFDASDITISASSSPENTNITAGGILLYKKLTPIETSIPLIYMDFGIDQVTVNNVFKIQWNSGGIITLETKVT